MENSDRQDKIKIVNFIFKLIAKINKASSEEEIRKFIPDLLKYTGIYSDAERVYIFELNHDLNCYTTTYEWCDVPFADNIVHIDVKDMPVWHNTFLCGDSIVIERLEEVKDTMPLEYNFLKPKNINTLIIVPLFANNQLSGFIGLDDPKLVDADLSIAILSNAGGHLASALNNIRMFNELNDKQRVLESNLIELQKEKKILEGLCIDYSSFYLCDLKNDVVETLKQTNGSNGSNVDQLACGYSFKIKYYYDNYVIKESAPDFLEKLNKDYLIAYLKQHKRFAYRYQGKRNKLGYEYFEVQIICLDTGIKDEYKVIMGFRVIDDIVKEDVAKQKQLEGMLDELRLNNEIISAISKMYWLIYSLDLINDTYDEVSSKEENYRLTGKSGKTSVQFFNACKLFVDEEYQESMHAFLDTSTLQDRLKDREEVTTEYKSKTGVWHTARFIVKTRDKDGKVTNVLYVAKDINDQKKNEFEKNEELKHLAIEAHKANIAKTDFLRRMSHDVRTPINGILGCIDIADRYPNDLDKQKEARTKVKTASGYLLNLVNDILDMNKLESGKIELQEVPFKLSKVIEDTNSIIKVQAKEAGLSYEMIESIIEHDDLIGSPLHLQQILMNIAGNAVKYNKEHGTIAVSTREIGSDNTYAEFELTCKDTGIGMSDEFQKTIFEPFAQENNSARTKYAGTGLGLSIAKKLIELQGGTLEFKSERDKGTEFVIRLSFKLGEKSDEEVNDNHNASLKGLRVLLAEDNELNMDIASFLLEDEGIEVIKAWNGKEALDMFTESNVDYYDAILMDLMMPVMDGLEATKKIRALNRIDAKRVPIFALTANAFIDDIQRSLDAGMNEHFSKPLQIDKVIKTLGKYCRK